MGRVPPKIKTRLYDLHDIRHTCISITIFPVCVGASRTLGSYRWKKKSVAKHNSTQRWYIERACKKQWMECELMTGHSVHARPPHATRPLSIKSRCGLYRSSSVDTNPMNSRSSRPFPGSGPSIAALPQQSRDVDASHWVVPRGEGAVLDNTPSSEWGRLSKLGRSLRKWCRSHICSNMKRLIWTNTVTEFSS